MSDERFLRFTGRVAELSANDRRMLVDRSTSSDSSVKASTRAIVEDVRVRGDAALKDMAARFDRAVLERVEVPRTMWRAALDRLDPALRAAMTRSAENLSAVHSANFPAPVVVRPERGITIVRRPDPLTRIGVYAPGGRAAYPSSVLMAAVPARVAGVSEVILCSPPDAGGQPSALVLAAAELANVDRVFAVGGAGAIAAMAFGTESVPRVDRIVGPGNAYVAEAKLQVCGFVGIDSPAGPSELAVIADESADPRAIAVEMLAQAEHDPDARVVAAVVGESLASRVVDALTDMLEAQPRREIIRRALASGGGVLTAATTDEAIAFANDYAAEHLLVIVADADAVVPRLRSAGTIFVGATTSVAFGDYMSGANHVLPTGGLARSYSGLSVLDFVRWTTVQAIDADAAASLSNDVAIFAEAEGLPGHALAARTASGR